MRRRRRAFPGWLAKPVKTDKTNSQTVFFIIIYFFFLPFQTRHRIGRCDCLIVTSVYIYAKSVVFCVAANQKVVPNQLGPLSWNILRTVQDLVSKGKCQREEKYENRSYSAYNAIYRVYRHKQHNIYYIVILYRWHIIKIYKAPFPPPGFTLSLTEVRYMICKMHRFLALQVIFGGMGFSPNIKKMVL